jgi:hypothetical protein
MPEPAGAKKRPKHISDAPLTRILQPHLLGNAGIGYLPRRSSRVYLEETRSISTPLKLIEMKPTVNEVVDHQSVLKKLH